MNSLTLTSLAPLARWLGYLLTLLTSGCLVGCASLNPQPPIETFASKLADEAIIPAVREGLSQGVEHLAIQAGAQGINPAYVVNFEGKWVVGIEGRASVGVEGVAGQLQISSASGDKTETSPHAANASAASGEHRRLAGASSSDDATHVSPADASAPLPDSGNARPSTPTSTLADSATRPSTLSVHIYDIDRDENKGFARLDDGTLVVIAGAADKLGQTVAIEVKGVVASPAGRLVTAKLAGVR